MSALSQIAAIQSQGFKQMSSFRYEVRVKLAFPLCSSFSVCYCCHHTSSVVLNIRRAYSKEKRGRCPDLEAAACRGRGSREKRAKAEAQAQEQLWAGYQRYVVIAASSHTSLSSHKSYHASASIVPNTARGTSMI